MKYGKSTNTMEIEELISVMSQLRDPERGCPWDLEQTFATIVPYTIEEAYEVADAVDRCDMDALRDELGDLLLQVVFHARIAEEQGRFSWPDVVRSIVSKLRRRHPHVFGSEPIRSAAEQKSRWEAIKAAEDGRTPDGRTAVLAGVSRTLPSLTRAAKLGRRAGAVGFDWADLAGVMAKVEEEIAEVRQALNSEPGHLQEEIGDLLFAVANLARKADLDPEETLRRANRKFESRFHHLESAVRSSGKSWAAFTPEELDGFWRAAKSAP